MNISQALVQAAASFALVKGFLEALAWIGAEEKDKLYRTQLVDLFEALDKQSL